MAAATFGELFTASYEECKKMRRPLLTGAFVFGAVIFLLLWSLSTVVVKGADDHGDYRWFLLLLIMYVFFIVFSLINYAYVTVVMIERVRSWKQAIMRSFRWIFPLIGVNIWIFLRSYGWVMFLGVPFLAMQKPLVSLIGGLLYAAGIVLYLVRLPRFIPATVLIVTEGKGIVAAAKRSYDVTKGYWWKIVGNLLLLDLCIWAIVMIVMMVLGPVLTFMFESYVSVAVLQDQTVSVGQLMGTGLLVSLLVSLLLEYMYAFMLAFIVKLTRTMVENPRKG